MSVTLRVSSKLNGEITISPINGTLKANAKATVSKENLLNPNVQLAIRKNFLTVESIDEEDIEYLKKYIISIKNISNKEALLEGTSIHLNKNSNVYIHKNVLKNINLQNNVDAKQLEVSEISSSNIPNILSIINIPKKEKVKEEIKVIENIQDIKQEPNQITKDTKNNFDELFLKLMNINDTINNVKEDVNIIKSNIKTKKPKQVRPKKVFQEVKTLDLTITDKEINNIIDNKNDVFLNLLNELKK